MGDDATPWSRENCRALALVQALLSKEIDLRTIEAPSHYLEFLFDMLCTTGVKVKKAKWTEEPGELGFRRFDRLVQQLKKGLPALPVEMALQLLTISNDYMGDVEEISRYGFDVRQHFHISSSFGGKGKILHEAVRYMRPATMVEVGTAYGMSTSFALLALQKYVPSGTLWTIEAGEQQFRKSEQKLAAMFGPMVRSVYGRSDRVLPDIIDQMPALNLYFHDGGHNFENIKGNFEIVRSRLSNGSLIIVDDIRWWDNRVSAEDPRCYPAWERIMNDDAVSCAVELNEAVGLALFRR